MSQPLKIIGSYTSPFSRIVRLVAEELAIEYEMDVMTFFMRNTPEQEQHIKENNPLMKIPVLIDGDNTIIDSNVIISYLLKNFSSDSDFRAAFPTNMAEQNIATVIYGVIEGGVIRFMIKAANPEVNIESGYTARSLERMHSGLEWLEKQPTLGDSFGVPEALLICATEWFKKRNVIDLSAYKKLEAVCQKFANRPSVIKTRIPENA